MKKEMPKIIQIQNEIVESIAYLDRPFCLGLLTNKVDFGTYILESSVANALEMHERKDGSIVYFNQIPKIGRINDKLFDVYGVDPEMQYDFYEDYKFHYSSDPFVELFNSFEGHDPSLLFINQLAHFHLTEDDTYDSFHYKYFEKAIKSKRFQELSGYKEGSFPFNVIFTASYEYAERGWDIEDDDCLCEMGEPDDGLKVIMLDQINDGPKLKSNKANLQKTLSYFTRVLR